MRATNEFKRIGVRTWSLGVFLLGCALSLSAVTPARAALSKATASGRYVLELDGKQVAFVRSFEGGDAVATAIEEPIGSSAFTNKHPSNVRFEDLVLEVGLEGEPVLYQWIADTLEGKVARKSGAVIVADVNYKAVERVVFKNAFLSAIEWTDFDAADGKSSVLVTLRLSAEQVRTEAAQGEAVQLAMSKSKAAQSGNFRFELDGVDTNLVSKVEGLAVTFGAASSASGERREPVREPTRLALKNLMVTVSATGAADFRKWHDSFVVQGQSGDGGEKAGAIVLLGPDLKTELARISLFNLGILSASYGKRETNADKASSLNVELYLERARLVMPGVTNAAPKAVRAVAPAAAKP